MAEAASLAIGIAALFNTCVEGFKIISAAQGFAKDFEILSASFQQQRLRFLLWGESVGLVSHDNTVARPYLQNLDAEHIRPTILGSLSSVQHLLQCFEKYACRYRSKVDATFPLVNISSRTTLEDRFAILAKRNQKQKSFKAITRWAVFDAEAMKETVQKLRDLIDGLVEISNQLNTLQRNSAYTAAIPSPASTVNVEAISFQSLVAVTDHSVLMISSRQIEELV